MPLLVMTEEETAEALGGADSDLKWLLSDGEVPVDIQAALYHRKFNKLRVFLGLGENRAEVRAAILADIGLSPTDGHLARQQVALVLAAWDAAKEYVTKENSVRAEARASNLPRPMSATEHAAMRQAFEARYGRLENNEVPARHYLGTKIEDIEENEPKAEALKEVASKDDGEEDFLMSEVGKDGHVRVRKGARDGKAPSNSEELRARLRLVGHCWLFLRTKHANRSWLMDITEKTYSVLADHLLGKYVAGAVIQSSSGDSVRHPPWSLVLSYEFELRKWSYEQVVVQNIGIHEALTLAMKNTEIKEKYFTTPYSLGAQQDSLAGKRQGKWLRPADGDGDWEQRPRKQQRAKDKKRAKGKGKGKGKGVGGSGGLASRTPDGRMICFKYNNQQESCDGRCNMIHCCQRCFQKGHAAWKCTGGGSEAEGQQGLPPPS
jgi:hypothetical protein